MWLVRVESVSLDVDGLLVGIGPEECTPWDWFLVRVFRHWYRLVSLCSMCAVLLFDRRMSLSLNLRYMFMYFGWVFVCIRCFVCMDSLSG